jgi:hypothetical protein
MVAQEEEAELILLAAVAVELALLAVVLLQLHKVVTEEPVFPLLLLAHL